MFTCPRFAGLREERGSSAKRELGGESRRLASVTAEQALQTLAIHARREAREQLIGARLRFASLAQAQQCVDRDQLALGDERGFGKALRMRVGPRQGGSGRGR